MAQLNDLLVMGQSTMLGPVNVQDTVTAKRFEGDVLADTVGSPDIILSNNAILQAKEGGLVFTQASMGDNAIKNIHIDPTNGTISAPDYNIQAKNIINFVSFDSTTRVLTITGP